MFKKIIGLGAGAVLAFAIILPSVSRGDVNNAVAYLKSKPLSAWSIMALAAAGENPSADSLKNISDNQALDLEAPILAITSIGKDPRTFGSQDLVAKLKNYYDGTQLGSASILNDDIFGLLALKSAGEKNTEATVSGLRTFIVSKQNSDGGWGYAVGGTSDTNTTAAGIMALIASGSGKTDSAISKALDYLRLSQNTDGGFPYDPKSSWGTDSDASSDSWIIMALRSADEDPGAWTKNGKSPTDSLGTFSALEGFYRYQTGSNEDSFSPTTTSYAVIALSGKYLPVGTITPASPSQVHFSYRIEGSGQELCSGEANGSNAMDAIKSAGDACGITYHIASLSFGDYVDQIGEDKAAGADGWMYLVNNIKPSVGAADYKLNNNDEVLWYYGDYSWQPLRLTLNSTSTTGSSAGGRLEYFDGSNWKYADGATIETYAGTAATATDGTFSITLANGSYRLYGEKNGFIRSNRASFLVGSTNQDKIDLSVDLGGSSSGTSDNSGKEISFSVEADNSAKSLGFGKINNGYLPVKKVTLTNLSSNATHFESSVSGDEIFRNYLALDGKTWRLFGTNLLPGASKQTSVSLKLPAGYSGEGVRNGSLIFWATPSQ